MPRGRSTSDPTTLAMALVGYELEKQRIEQKIQEIRAQLGGRATGSRGTAHSTAKTGGPGRKRTLSASARRRIAAAQRKRWAEHRKKQAQSARGE